MQVGDFINTTIYGRVMVVQITAAHPGGTIDVVTKDGNCYRISGLAL